MPKLDSETKAKILSAAEKVFHTHGLLGARTSMIAEMAGISRTALHYHYSTKEALFIEILNETFNTGLEHLKPLLHQEELPLKELIILLVEAISNLFQEKPNIPIFIVILLNENPHFGQLMAGQAQDNLPSLLEHKLIEARAQGIVFPEITGEDIMLNVYGICSLPYLTADYIKHTENRSDEQMQAFLNQRIQKNIDFSLRGIFKN